MKHLMKSLAAVAILTMISCGGKEEKKQDSGVKLRTESVETVQETTTTESTVKASERVDLTTKGVGPVKNVELGATIDQDMAAKGKTVYEANCLACHKTDKRFIGPAPKGILERRTPEWVMNMILNPEGMVKEDPLAKDLLIEFNGSPMANQNLTEQEARHIVEYFRTL